MDNKNSKQNYCVYMHRNKANGKVYIGMTKNLKQRWSACGVHYYKKHSHTRAFSRAIEKYGWDGFEHIVLAEGLTFDEANKMEIAMIAEYKSNIYRYSNPEYGYNLTDGGQGVAGHRWSDEERKEISHRITGSGNPMYGKKHSDYTKSLISQANTGRFSDGKSPLLGKIVSAESRKKMSENHADVSGGNNPRAKPCYCVETGEYFETIDEAGKHFGLARSTIRRSCALNCATKSKLNFRYVA